MANNIKELEDAIEKCAIAVKKQKKEDSVMNELGEMIKAFRESDISGMTADDLSCHALKLGTLLAYLGSKASLWEMKTNTSYVHRKFKTSVKFLELPKDMTATERTHLSENSTKDLYEAETYCNYMHSTLKYLHSDVKNIASLMQSRIKVLLKEDYQ